MCRSAANGAVQGGGERNQDQGVLQRGARPGPEGGPGPEGEGGGRDVADGEQQSGQVIRGSLIRINFNYCCLFICI